MSICFSHNSSLYLCFCLVSLLIYTPLQPMYSIWHRLCIAVGSCSKACALIYSQGFDGFPIVHSAIMAVPLEAKFGHHRDKRKKALVADTEIFDLIILRYIKYTPTAVDREERELLCQVNALING